MSSDKVTIFKPYPFELGQKIRIEGGPRNGDWQVIGVSEHKVKLQCPVSKKTFDWDRFCYLEEERTGEVWPQLH